MNLQEATSVDPMIGRVLGGDKYKIESLIGRGGQGLVYLAKHRDGDPEVVVKILTPNRASDAEAKARFAREADRLRAVSHPNIVSMLDYGQDGERQYLVMEYVRGEQLGDYVDRVGQLTLTQFVPIAAQILKAIGHVHSRGIMVRDIKPANIMLCTRRGRANFVKLLDFGLARLVNEPRNITTQNVVGTVGYLSPEQIRGDEPDIRVDVYALGVLFYYLLSGRLPFEGENLESVLYKTSHNKPPPLADALPPGNDVPEGLITLIESCLSKDPQDRPDHADAIVEGLIDVVPAALFRLPRAPGFTAEPTTGSLNIGRPSRTTQEVTGGSPALQVHTNSGLVVMHKTSSRPGWQLALGAVALLLVGGGVGSWWFQGNESEGKPEQATTSAAVVAPQLEAAPLDDPEPETTQEPNPSPSPVRAPAAVAAASPSPQIDAPKLVAPQPESSPLPERGSMAMGSEPTAQLFIDGQPVGSTPFESDLAAGEHTVRLEARGHEPWSDKVVVETGEKLQLVIKLRARRASSRPARRPRRAAPRPDTQPQTPAQPETKPAKPAKAGSSAIAPGQMPRARQRAKAQRNIDTNIWGED